MKLVIFILFAFQTCIIAQSLERDYELLAKYSILKYTLEKSFSENETYNLFISSAVRNVEEIIKNDGYKYSVDSICSFGKFKIISITDETNFQLHGLHYSVYAIDTTNTNFDRYYSIEWDKHLDFINDILYKYPKRSTDRYKLIEVYNTLFKSFHRYGPEIVFYHEDNKSRFQYLKPDDPSNYAMKDYNHGIETCYVISDKNLTEFHRLLYQFECDKMTVEDFLLYKIQTTNDTYQNSGE